LLYAMERAFHVYMFAGKSGVLYVGVTGHLARDQLVWFERHATARAAIAREKEIKKWRRSKKIALIEATNPQWQDLIERL
jgi:putative endonuclease